MLKIVRRIMRVLFFLVLAVVAAGLGALVVLTTPERGRDNLAGLSSSSLACHAGAQGDGRRHQRHLVGRAAARPCRGGGQAGPWPGAARRGVDWSPLALLSKTFRAEHVGVGRIEVARLPQQEPQPQAEQGGTFSLPVSVEVKEIDLPDIALGEALAEAGIAELAARGSVSAQASPLAVASDLSVSRRDGKGGSLAAKVHFAPADNRLDLDVKASEPQGGIIANALQLPGTPAVDIALSLAARWPTGTAPQLRR